MAEPKTKPRPLSVIALNQPEQHLVTWHHLRADSQPDLLTPELHVLCSPSSHPLPISRGPLFPVKEPLSPEPAGSSHPQKPPANPSHPLPALSCLHTPFHCCTVAIETTYPYQAVAGAGHQGIVICILSWPQALSKQGHQPEAT